MGKTKKKVPFLKQAVKTGSRMRRGVLSGLSYSGIQTPTYKKSSSKRTYGRPGRPRGVYKYSIVTETGERKPVHVYEYRKWARKQRALQRLTPRERYPPNSTPPVYEEERYPQPPEEHYDRQPRPDNILNAPNINRGELRGAGTQGPIQHMDTINKPIANPHGDYFTDVDPFTGKQILRKRVRERWTQGGA